MERKFTPTPPLTHLDVELRLRCLGAVRLTVGADDADAALMARRLTFEGWSPWREVEGLPDDACVWCGKGTTLQLRATAASVLLIDDELTPADLPRIATVTSALEWLGLPTSGNRPDLNARLEDAP